MVGDLRTAYVVQLSWQPNDQETAGSMFQVLRLDGAGRICEMADYRQLGLATRTAKRFARPGAG